MGTADERKLSAAEWLIEGLDRFDAGAKLKELEHILDTFRSLVTCNANALDALAEAGQADGVILYGRPAEEQTIRAIAHYAREDARDVRQATAALREWVPLHQPGRLRRKKQPTPFLTESYLYELLGKEDARTLMALLRPLMEAEKG